LCELLLDKIVYNPDNHAQLTDEEMIKFARDIAQGMAHLASRTSYLFYCSLQPLITCRLVKIVHRDLAVRNGKFPKLNAIY